MQDAQFHFPVRCHPLAIQGVPLGVHIVAHREDYSGAVRQWQRLLAGGRPGGGGAHQHRRFAVPHGGSHDFGGPIGGVIRHHRQRQGQPLAACGEESSSSKNNGGTTTAGAATTIEGNANGSTAAGETNGGTTAGELPEDIKDITQGPTRTVNRNTEVTAASVEGVNEEIRPEVTRTTDKNGNATEEFINSVNGFSLVMKNPWGMDASSPIYKSAQAVEQTVEARFGVTIDENMLEGDYNSVVAAMMAAGQRPGHVLKVQDFNFSNYFNQNWMANLTAPAQKAGVTFREPWFNQESRKYFNINNKQVAWTGADGYSPYLVFYNKEHIADAGLKEPMDLAKTGEWTWDKMDNSRKGLVTAENGKLWASMAISNGGNMVDLSSGTPKTNVRNSVVMDALNQIDEWIDDKTLQISSGSWDTAYNEFWSGQASMIVSSSYVLGKGDASNLYGNVGSAPFPKGPDADGYTSMIYSQFIDFVPNGMDTDTVAKVLFIRNEIYRQSYRYWARDYIINNRAMFTAQDDLDFYYALTHATSGYNVATDISNISESNSAGDGTQAIATEVMTGAKSPREAVDTYYNALVKQFSDTWGTAKITG